LFKEKGEKKKKKKRGGRTRPSKQREREKNVRPSEGGRGFHGRKKKDQMKPIERGKGESLLSLDWKKPASDNEGRKQPEATTGVPSKRKKGGKPNSCP